jgi:hypothetical protein
VYSEYLVCVHVFTVSTLLKPILLVYLHLQSVALLYEVLITLAYFYVHHAACSFGWWLMAGADLF